MLIQFSKPQIFNDFVTLLTFADSQHLAQVRKQALLCANPQLLVVYDTAFLNKDVLKPQAIVGN